MAKLKSNEENDVLARLMKFCAYQERSVSEVKEKLRETQAPEEVQQRILDFLLTQGFLSESRFADAFARGRFRLKKWGRMKIASELRQRNIKEESLSNALNDINPDEYKEALIHLALQKGRTVKGANLFEKRNKVARFLMQKGYEGDLVWEVVKEFITD